MAEIKRFGDSARWSDMVVHRGTAYWVEVADDPTRDSAGQIAQVLEQIDATLLRLGASRSDLLQVLIYLSDLSDAAALNRQWDLWVAPGAPPVRACVQAGLSPGYRVEMVITAAVSTTAGMDLN
ncbi:MAG: putative aminoacrylate peracid reductase RutC [Planctomycetota bacterium]